MKIYIIGPVGSGKTTFSEKLSKKYNIEKYELDKVVWDDDNGHVKRSVEEINELFEKIINKKSWIIEDVGRNKLKKGRDKADIIYYLKISRFKSYYRVIKRWIKQRLGKERYNHPPTIGQLFYFISTVNSYFKKEPKKLEELKKYKDKVIYQKNVDIICKSSLRNLKDQKEDYKCLYKWYQIKEVHYSFEQRPLSYDEIVNKYKPRTKNNSPIKVLMIEYKDKPIGIVQYQKLSKENERLYNIKNDNTYEIDIFIGETKQHNKGIGKEVISEITEYLFNEKNAKRVVMCPVLNNKKAINCYKKCGYKEKSIIKAKDTIGNFQEYQLMIKEKER